MTCQRTVLLEGFICVIAGQLSIRSGTASHIHQRALRMSGTRDAARNIVCGTGPCAVRPYRTSSTTTCVMPRREGSPARRRSRIPGGRWSAGLAASVRATGRHVRSWGVLHATLLCLATRALRKAPHFTIPVPVTTLPPGPPPQPRVPSSPLPWTMDPHPWCRRSAACASSPPPPAARGSRWWRRAQGCLAAAPRAPPPRAPPR